MTVYAYLRVSTNKGQTTENQRKEIVDAGYAVTEWFSEEGVSGKKNQFERPMFKEMFDKMLPGDVCVVTKIDRLGRTARDTLNTIEIFKKAKVKVVVLQLGGMDMTSAAGKLLVTLLAAVAEMERDLTVERIVSGIARTEAEGTKLGRPLKIEPDVYANIVKDKKEVGMTLGMLSKKYAIAISSLHKSLALWNEDASLYEKEYALRQAQYKAAEEKRMEKAKRVTPYSHVTA